MGIASCSRLRTRGRECDPRRNAGLARLDAFIGQVELLPIDTLAMRRDAVYWAQPRQQGRPTAPDPALGADVILDAQAATLGRPSVVVATSNPKHISRFVEAEL